MSTSSTEFMIMRHVPSGDLFVFRVEHGGEMNGDHSFVSGTRGPYRKTTDPLTLLDFRGEYNVVPEHLAWVEENTFERVDLVS